MASSAILVVPCCEDGRGGGHLSRCVSLVKDLRVIGREACLFLEQNKLTKNILNLFQTMNINSEWIITNINAEKKYDFIVLDRFQTPKDELSRWKSIAPVIGIDEGGLSRDYFDFLIDILIPEKMSKSRGNIASLGLVIKNFTTNQHEIIPAVWTRTIDKKSKSKPVKANDNSRLNILITFGHEDSAGLGVKTARYLSSKSGKFKMDITLLRGALSVNGDQIAVSDVRIIDFIPNLAEHLNEYDLVITHYGITAYEAFYAGVPVLLAHPTSYHNKLAKSAGFVSFNKKSIIKFTTKAKKARKEKRMDSLLRAPSASLRLNFFGHHLSLLKNNASLADLINYFSPQVNNHCPVCAENFAAKSNSLLITRCPDRTYRLCPECGIIFMDRAYPPPIEYSKDYFFESYKKQYGKTYLEDFDNIKIAGKHRLKRIKRENSSSNPLLLDIGCAYGPFLAAAKEEGFSPAGIDPAEDAVRYVQEKLGIPALHGFFPDILNMPHSPASSFDVVTLWFVIEHFRDCTKVLSEIKRILKPGGILAFSTPSFSGISARGMFGGKKSLKKFLSASPADHYTVWSPKMCKKALSLAGFKVKKTVSAGHHPERFPLLGKLASTKKSPVFWLLLAISKIFNLGDTFEVYAQVNN